MTCNILRRAGIAALLLPLMLGVNLLAGCGALDVSDPTAIEDEDLNDAAGADLLRRAALQALYSATSNGALTGGVLADEFLSDPPPGAVPGAWAEEALDRRESVQYEQLRASETGYSLWQAARRAATIALSKLRTGSPSAASQAHAGEMFAVRGFAALRLAEDFCPGFPLHDIVEFTPRYGPPLSTNEALSKALADFDSALAYAVDSARVQNLARVGRARALLGLGRLAEAAAAAAPVPTNYVAPAEYFAGSVNLRNQLGAFGLFGDLSRGVANQEGGTGLNFVSAADPRVRTTALGKAGDGVTVIYAPAKYPNGSAPIVFASGVEARLIEAEAALNGGGDWRTILNALRTTCTDAAPNPCPDPAPAGSGGVAGLPPLADPGTNAARLDLLFRERAFWLFATGHRLGDLRRLLGHYGRLREAVFPAGAYRLGGTYGTATAIPFPGTLEAPYNPAITGCTSR